MVCDYSESSRRGATISVFILGGAIITILFAYISFGDSNKVENVRSLMMAAILFRHGDRNPTGTYPNDPHKNHKWIGGYGALSTVGSKDMYKLGQQLRLRYIDLIPSNGMYSIDEMYVQSSKHERCLMSASSFLAGFMPPPENKNPLPIAWQPIPVNYESREKDIIVMQKAACPVYDKLLESFYNPENEVLRNINEQNKDLYEFLTIETGKNITTIHHVESLYNTLQIEESNGLELPNWSKTVYPDRMLPLAKRNLKLLTENDIMKKIKAGPLLTEIFDKMEMIMKSDSMFIPKKLFLYSGHDVTLVNVMNSLQILDQTSEKPDFGATLGFELHRNSDIQDLEVKILYYQNSLAEPKDISIPNCVAPCTLTRFGKSIDLLINRNYHQICDVNSGQTT